MAYNLEKEVIVNQLLNDIGELKRQMRELRSNQTNILQYGNIIINGNTNQITLGSPVTITLDQTGYIGIKNSSAIEIIQFNSTGMHIKNTSSQEIVLVDSNGVSVKTTAGVLISLIDNTGYKLYDASANEIVRIDSTGITIKTTGTTDTQYIFFKKSGNNVGLINFRRYIPVSDEVSVLALYGLHSTTANRNTYIGLDIFSNDLTTRDVFFEMNSNWQASAFSYSFFNFSKDGVAATFSVKIDDTSGNGYMVIPRRASDPASVGVGTMYYSSSLGKFRILDGAGWRSL